MAEKKQFNGKIVIVLLAIIILALVGAIVYLVNQNNVLKSSKAETDNEVQSLQAQVQEQNETLDMIRNILSDSTKDSVENVLNESSESGTQTSEINKNENGFKELLDKYISVIKSIENLKSDEYQYKLAYVNNDNLPELVVDKQGYHTSIITPQNGKLFIIQNADGDPKSNELKDNTIKDLGDLTLLGYGTSHRSGYDYLEKKNTIICTIPNVDETVTEVYTIENNKIKLDYSLSAKTNEETYSMNGASIDKEQYGRKIKEINNAESLEKDMMKGQAAIDYFETLK